jgi:hypothetical protein
LKRKSPTESQSSPASTASPFGLKILVEPDDLTPPQINIVFVHGLGGSAEGTWTDTQTDACWPRWLSEVKGLERARIMVFGYDSGWGKIWKVNNILDISDFAKQLTHDLWCHFSECGDVDHLFILDLLNILDADDLCGAQHGGACCKKGTFVYEIYVH